MQGICLGWLCGQRRQDGLRTRTTTAGHRQDNGSTDGTRRVAGYVTYVKAAHSRWSVRSDKSPTDCSKSRQGEARI